MTVPQIRIEITGLPSPERLALCYHLHRALLDCKLPVTCNEVSVPHNYLSTIVTYRNSLLELGGRITLATVDGGGEVRPCPPTPSSSSTSTS